MMRRILVGAAVASVAVLAACSDPTAPAGGVALVARASGGSSTGGGGGGGGGGGTTTGGGGGGGGGSARPCAILSYGILNNVATSTAVPSFWAPNTYYQAIAAGTAEKSCDVVPNATIVFEDITGPSDGCEVVLSPWVNNPAYLNPKYGAKPLSRYQEGFIYYTGPDCVGKPRVLRATLTDPSVGGKVTSVTVNWTP